jgi:hypothetical protein
LSAERYNSIKLNDLMDVHVTRYLYQPILMIVKQK